MNAPYIEMVLCGANLFGFASALDRRQRDDWLHSNLLAQLGADRHCPRRASGWQAHYEKTLGHMAWLMLDTRTTEATPPDACTIARLLTAQLPGVLAEPQRLAVADMLGRLQAAHGSPCGQLLRRRMCPADAGATVFNRLAFALSLVLSEKDALTLQLDFTTAQALGPDWLGMALQPQQLQGRARFGYTYWALGDYGQNRALVDRRVNEQPDSKIFPWHFQAALT